MNTTSVAANFLASAAPKSADASASANSKNSSSSDSSENQEASFDLCLKSCVKEKVTPHKISIREKVFVEVKNPSSENQETSDSESEGISVEEVVASEIQMMQAILRQILSKLQGGQETQATTNNTDAVTDVASTEAASEIPVEAASAETEEPILQTDALLTACDTEEISSSLDSGEEADLPVNTEENSTQATAEQADAEAAQIISTDAENTSNEITANPEQEVESVSATKDEISQETEEISTEQNNEIVDETENTNSSETTTTDTTTSSSQDTTDDGSENETTSIEDGKENGVDPMTRGKGRKIGAAIRKLFSQSGEHSQKGKNRIHPFAEDGKKYPNVEEGSESGIAHKILSHLKHEEMPFLGTSYAENEKMRDLMQAWNDKNPELDALITERTGLNGLEDLQSVDQLRNNSWKEAHASQSVKTEILPKANLQDVPEILNKALNSANLALPKRIEIPLQTPEGSKISLFLQEAGGHIRAQISTNDKLVMEWANRELSSFKGISFDGTGNVKWTPPQFEQQENYRDQMNDRQSSQDQPRRHAKQQEDGHPVFEEAIEFLDNLRREES